MPDRTDPLVIAGGPYAPRLERDVVTVHPSCEVVDLAVAEMLN